MKKYPLALLTSLLIGTQAHSAASKYVECFSKITQAQNSELDSLNLKEGINSIWSKVGGYLLSKLPNSLEKEIAKMTGTGNRDMQELKVQTAEGRANFEDADAKTLNNKMDVVSKSFYAWDLKDNRNLVLLTPEGKILKTKLSDKYPNQAKISMKFSIKDETRAYYFSVNADGKCKKNCDDFIWLVDTKDLKDSVAFVKESEFPAHKTEILSDADAEKVAHEFLVFEVKHGISKIVGVEKSLKLGGEPVLPDPQDSSYYNKEAFKKSLIACNKDLAASKEADLLSDAVELLR